ncbi:MAG: glycerophosphodiester phosphodiesterase family protein, partial [Candidatus Lokiarchaeota archaeon]
RYDKVVGWEVDIQISFDGIPFLMHDHTLKRTTNVSAQFPSRKDDDPSLFTISELRQLDAGSWFVDKDPYGTIAKGIITHAEAESYRGIKVPTFEEVLNFTRDNNLFLDFDPYAPPASHPYHDEFYQILLNLTLDSGISLSNVMIPTTNITFLELINSTTPNILLGWGGHPSLTEFRKSPYNYSYINTGDDYTNQEYRTLTDAGVRVMVWTIESMERYSQLWCLGVEWVKTNSPYKFNNLQHPILYFTAVFYYSTWIVVIIVMAAIAFILLKFTTNKEQKLT